MRRVVVTGLGIVSSIGNNKQEVADALRHAKSGIGLNQPQIDHGFRSHVAGNLKLDIEEVGQDEVAARSLLLSPGKRTVSSQIWKLEAPHNQRPPDGTL